MLELPLPSKIWTRQTKVSEVIVFEKGLDAEETFRSQNDPFKRLLSSAAQTLNEKSSHCSQKTYCLSSCIAIKLTYAIKRESLVRNENSN
jgi:hypothetical protein